MHLSLALIDGASNNKLLVTDEIIRVLVVVPLSLCIINDLRLIPQVFFPALYQNGKLFD